MPIKPLPLVVCDDATIVIVESIKTFFDTMGVILLPAMG
jgi:hypothetical protein